MPRLAFLCPHFFSNSRTGWSKLRLAYLISKGAYLQLKLPVLYLFIYFLKYRYPFISWQNVRKLSSSYSALCIVAPWANRFRGLPKQFFGERCGNRDCYALSKKRVGGGVTGRIRCKAVNDKRNLNSLIPDGTLYDKNFNFLSVSSWLFPVTDFIGLPFHSFQFQSHFCGKDDLKDSIICTTVL